MRWSTSFIDPPLPTGVLRVPLNWNTLLKPLTIAGAAIFVATLLLWSSVLGYAALSSLVARQPLVALLGLLLMYAAHEAAHLLGHPGFGLTTHSVTGVHARYLAPYAHYDLPVSRSRFVFYMLLPTAMFVVAPLLVAWLVPAWAPVLAMLTIVNASAAVADWVAVWQVLRYSVRGELVVEHTSGFYRVPATYHNGHPTAVPVDTA